MVMVMSDDDGGSCDAMVMVMGDEQWVMGDGDGDG